MTTLTHLECSRCGTRVDASVARSRCACGGPLLARYDLEAARAGWSRDWIKNAPATMWRYAPVLPVRRPPSIVSLGEGMTPLIHARRVGERLGATNLWIKDEGRNPTATFQARGLSCAVSMAVELGITKVKIRSTGDAATALAAYAAAAGMEAHVVLPPGAPHSVYVECRAHGARVVSVAPEGVFDLSALQEPYRIEGAKTMGYEIAEQMSWGLPDAVVCPVGMGVIGAWKAFAELEQLGWTAGARPRMIAVRQEAAPALDDPLVLEVLRESGGTAVGVSRREAIAAALELAAVEGIFAAPGGGAAMAALPRLLAAGQLKVGERIVVVNSGSGLKHLEMYATRFPGSAGGEQDKLGGLITPR